MGGIGFGRWRLHRYKHEGKHIYIGICIVEFKDGRTFPGVIIGVDREPLSVHPTGIAINVLAERVGCSAWEILEMLMVTRQAEAQGKFESQVVRVKDPKEWSNN